MLKLDNLWKACFKMGKASKQEHGMGTIEISLLILIVGLIVFTGWYIVKAKTNLSSAYSSAGALPESSSAN